MDQDSSAQLQDRVQQAAANKTPLYIHGGNSKAFYGREVHGDALDVSTHRGIVHYEPTELVITARAGTPLQLIEQTLAEQQQMLAFEPPAFADTATLGGSVACNLSGPRRPFAGAARDFVLGTQLLNGKAEIIRFGGEVMKNVAGYDVSRLMAGALGTLGVMLEISLKVLPIPEQQLTLVQSCDLQQALSNMQQWSLRPLPISALCFYRDQLYIRLSGTPNAVQSAKTYIGGDVLEDGDRFWHTVKEQQHDFFLQSSTLWRVSLAADTAPLSIDAECFYEWGGALRWYRGEQDTSDMQRMVAGHGGHATLFRSDTNRDQVFQPLTTGLQRLHKNLKQAFDPNGILNPGRMYAEF